MQTLRFLHVERQRGVAFGQLIALKVQQLQPSRHAIVVPDLSRVRELLDGLEECPEDLYLIEGDPQSFDDSVFSVDELQNGQTAVFSGSGSSATDALPPSPPPHSAVHRR